MAGVEQYIRRRARIEGVYEVGGRWLAKVCSWYANEPACVNVDVTGIVDRFAKEEARRICEEECFGDEECEEDRYDICLEEAYERISETKMAEIIVRDFYNEIVEEALPDLVTELKPSGPRRRRTLLDYTRGG